MLLEVKDLEIEFHDHLIPERVVKSVDFALDEGEILGLVGESGSGKTMTGLAIAGLLSRHNMQKKGEILFQNRNLLDCERQKLRDLQGDEIGIIFQEPMTSLNPVRKIGWQVSESLRIHTKMTPEERKERVLSVLEQVELSEPEKIYEMYPHQLSGGMRQRVMIAAAMVCHPQILIADEPTTALDVTIQAQIVELLQKINREEKTAILFISHDLSLVKRLCHRVVVMQEGQIVEQGITEEIFRHPKEEYTKKLIAAIPDCEGEKEAENPNTETVLDVKHLNAYYRIRQNRKPFRKQVLHDLNFSIQKGEVLGLVGESGCGKTTLCLSLFDFLKDYEGEIKRPESLPQMVFQDPASSLNPAKRIGWLLEEPLRIRGGFSKEDRQRRAEEMLIKVGLDAKMRERFPQELSGGQRQRVAIGMALMLSPGLLIADEPVSALDVTIQAQILELLQKLKKEQELSMLFISHDLRVVYKLCDRLMIMKKGVIVEEGRTAEVYRHPSHPYTRELLRASGIEVKE